MKVPVCWSCGHLNVPDGSAVGGAPVLVIYRYSEFPPSLLYMMWSLFPVVRVRVCVCMCVKLWHFGGGEQFDLHPPAFTLLLPDQRGRQPRAPGVFGRLCLT